MPAITRSSVLLPLPDGPSSADDLADVERRADAVEHGRAVERDRDVADVERAHVDPALAGGRRRRDPEVDVTTSRIVAAARIAASANPGPGAASRCGRAGARSRSGASRRRCGRGSSSRRTRRARSPRRARRRRRAGARGTARRSPPTPGRGAPSVAAASVRRGSTERSTPSACGRRTARRSARGRPGRATTSPRQSTGAASKVISIPKPIVTADVPIGSISPTSSSARPAGGGDRQAGDAADHDREQGGPRGDATEFHSASTGSMPSAARAGSRCAEVRPAAADQPVGVENDRTTSASSGASDRGGRSPAATARRAPPAPRASPGVAGRRSIARLCRRCATADHATTTPSTASWSIVSDGGAADVAELGRPPPDLDLDRPRARGAEHADHAERGEREQEHDRRRGRQRRPEQGSVISTEDVAARSRRASPPPPPCRSGGAPRRRRPGGRRRRG